MKKKVIYIDDDGNHNDLAKELEENIDKYFKKSFVTTTFADWSNTDLSTEECAIKGIESADIVIPILSSQYLNYLTKKIELLFNSIIKSEEKYLFPIFYKKSTWSSYDWVVKSKVFPNGEISLSELSTEERESEFQKLYTSLQDILDSTKSDIQAKKSAPISKKKSKDSKTIFISHDHEDSDFAELMTLKFEKHNIISWLDTTKLKIGQDWREEIDEGIKSADAVVAIMTPGARKSEYVTYEWAFAWGNGIKIFPIMLKQTALHPRLESLQYLDFTNKLTRPWDELINSILILK